MNTPFARRYEAALVRSLYSAYMHDMYQTRIDTIPLAIFALQNFMQTSTCGKLSFKPNKIRSMLGCVLESEAFLETE